MANKKTLGCPVTDSQAQTVEKHFLWSDMRPEIRGISASRKFCLQASKKDVYNRPNIIIISNIKKTVNGVGRSSPLYIIFTRKACGFCGLEKRGFGGYNITRKQERKRQEKLKRDEEILEGSKETAKKSHKKQSDG